MSSDTTFFIAEQAILLLICATSLAYSLRLWGPFAAKHDDFQDADAAVAAEAFASALGSSRVRAGAGVSVRLGSRSGVRSSVRQPGDHRQRLASRGPLVSVVRQHSQSAENDPPRVALPVDVDQERKQQAHGDSPSRPVMSVAQRRMKDRSSLSQTDLRRLTAGVGGGGDHGDNGGGRDAAADTAAAAASPFMHLAAQTFDTSPVTADQSLEGIRDHEDKNQSQQPLHNKTTTNNVGDENQQDQQQQQQPQPQKQPQYSHAHPIPHNVPRSEPPRAGRTSLSSLNEAKWALVIGHATPKQHPSHTLTEQHHHRPVANNDGHNNNNHQNNVGTPTRSLPPMRSQPTEPHSFLQPTQVVVQEHHGNSNAKAPSHHGGERASQAKHAAPSRASHVSASHHSHAGTLHVVHQRNRLRARIQEVWRRRRYRESGMYREFRMSGFSDHKWGRAVLWVEAQTIPYVTFHLMSGVMFVCLLRLLDPYGWHGIWDVHALTLFKGLIVLQLGLALSFHQYKISTVAYAAVFRAQTVRFALLCIILTLILSSCLMTMLFIFMADTIVFWFLMYRVVINIWMIVLFINYGVLVFVVFWKVDREARNLVWYPMRRSVLAILTILTLALLTSVPRNMNLARSLDDSSILRSPESSPGSINWAQSHTAFWTQIVAVQAVLAGLTITQRNKIHVMPTKSQASHAPNLSRNSRAPVQ